jgi:hypothetical protein
VLESKTGSSQTFLVDIFTIILQIHFRSRVEKPESDKSGQFRTNTAKFNDYVKTIFKR